MKNIKLSKIEKTILESKEYRYLDGEKYIRMNFHGAFFRDVLYRDYDYILEGYIDYPASIPGGFRTPSEIALAI